jgi:outer membrane murein-binding lipoprotein Lpp
MNGGRQKTDWLSPQNLLALLGMAGMVLMSYQSFRDDTRDKIGELRTAVAVLNAKVERLEHGER